jgi:hypothetical protein
VQDGGASRRAAGRRAGPESSGPLRRWSACAIGSAAEQQAVDRHGLTNERCGMRVVATSGAAGGKGDERCGRREA